jgi:DNA-binding beta-propeller fold protein YncE
MATDTAGSQISFGGSSQPAGIAISPDGTTAWVADQGLGAVDPITTATNTPGTPITVGGEPTGIAITPNGATAYVSNQNGTIDPVDLATRTAGTPISVGGASFSAIAVTPDGSTAYAADQNNGVVYPIDLATDTVGPSISVGSAFAAPDAIAITPNGATAYVVNNQDGTVVPIDTATDTAGPGIPDVGYGAQYIAISPDGTTAYVSNNETVEDDDCCADTVTPIDTATDTAGTPSTVVGIGDDEGGASGSVAVTPDGTTVWAGGSSNTMVPIISDTASDTSLSPCALFCGLITFTPDQGPSAALSASTTAGTTTLDASASVAGSSPIVSYSWDFGDGSPIAVTSTPSTTHVYPTPGTYTPTVTETDAAGTSTSQVFTGQTASLNGSPAAEASASVVIVNQDCESNSTCTATLESPSTPTSPAQSVTVTAPTPSGASEVLSVTSGPGRLKCSNTGFHQVGNVTSYAATFTPTGNVKVTDLIGGATSTTGVKVCFAGTGSSPPHTYLAPCSLSPPPCISNLSVVAGGVKVALKVPAADPRYRIQGIDTAVESPTGLPATAAIGQKVSITGTGLLGPDGKTPPSVGFTSVNGSTIRATVATTTATKIKVKVPNGAASGLVTLIWPQETATAKITISAAT